MGSLGQAGIGYQLLEESREPSVGALHPMLPFPDGRIAHTKPLCKVALTHAERLASGSNAVGQVVPDCSWEVAKVLGERGQVPRVRSTLVQLPVSDARCVDTNARR